VNERGKLLALLMVAVGVLLGTVAVAGDFSILGRRLVVRQGPGGEAARRVTVVARQTDSGITSLSNPVASGAILRVFANGATAQEQMFSLPAAGWTAITNGYRWTATGLPDAAPVAEVQIVLTPGGNVRLKAVLRGDVGDLALSLTPPNPGGSGGLALDVLYPDPIPGVSAHFCVGLGGAAGGAITRNTAGVFKIRNAIHGATCAALPTPHWPPSPTPGGNPTACDTLGACSASPHPTFEPPTPTPGPTPRSNPTACDTPGAGCPTPV